MKRMLTAIALVMATPAMAYVTPKTCEEMADTFMNDRQKQDIKEGAEFATVLSRGIYNGGKCYTLLIEFFKKDGIIWNRRAVIDPVNRELFALFQQGLSKDSTTCSVKVDGERAHCIDLEDFERVIKDNYGFDSKLPRNDTLTDVHMVH